MILCFLLSEMMICLIFFYYTFLIFSSISSMSYHYCKNNSSFELVRFFISIFHCFYLRITLKTNIHIFSITKFNLLMNILLFWMFSWIDNSYVCFIFTSLLLILTSYSSLYLNLIRILFSSPFYDLLVGLHNSLICLH